MKKGFFRRCVAGCAGILIAVFLIGSVHGQEKTVKLKYSNFFPPVHPISKLAEEWGKEVEKRTSGRVKIAYFPGNTLTPPMQTYDSVVKGIADIGQNLLAYSPGRLPLSEVLHLPLGYTSGYQSTMLINAYYNKFKPKEFDDVKVMYLHGSGPDFIHTRKVLSSIDGIKGLRIKANAENAGIITSLGGVPLTIPITETYDGLLKGLCDGILIPVEALKGWRFAEVLKCTLENHAVSCVSTQYVIMNKNKWNALSKADQEAIEKINQEWMEKQARLWVELDKEAKEFAIQKGVKWVTASKEEETATAEKMRPVFAKYVEMTKTKGLPGEEALKFCQDYLKAHP